MGDFIDGFMTGIRPFGSAVRLLLVTSIGVLALMLLGIALIYSAREFRPPTQSVLALVGEGVLLLGGLLMVAGCVLTWMRVFRARFNGTRGAVESNGGEHHGH